MLTAQLLETTLPAEVKINIQSLDHLPLINHVKAYWRDVDFSTQDYEYQYGTSIYGDILRFGRFNRADGVLPSESSNWVTEEEFLDQNFWWKEEFRDFLAWNQIPVRSQNGYTIESLSFDADGFEAELLEQLKNSNKEAVRLKLWRDQLQVVLSQKADQALKRKQFEKFPDLDIGAVVVTEKKELGIVIDVVSENGSAQRLIFQYIKYNFEKGKRKRNVSVLEINGCISGHLFEMKKKEYGWKHNGQAMRWILRNQKKGRKN